MTSGISRKLARQLGYTDEQYEAHMMREIERVVALSKMTPAQRRAARKAEAEANKRRAAEFRAKRLKERGISSYAHLASDKEPSND